MLFALFFFYSRYIFNIFNVTLLFYVFILISRNQHAWLYSVSQLSVRVSFFFLHMHIFCWIVCYSLYLIKMLVIFWFYFLLFVLLSFQFECGLCFGRTCFASPFAVPFSVCAACEYVNYAIYSGHRYVSPWYSSLIIFCSFNQYCCWCCLPFVHSIGIKWDGLFLLGD